MANPLTFSAHDLQLFVLAWFRITGVMLVGPLFGSEIVPARVKAVFSFIFALLFYPLIRGRASIEISPNLLLYVVSVAMELGVGLLIGFTATLLFSAVQLGGQMIDQELGLSLANIIDPITNEQISIMSQFKLFLSMIVYLLIDGHHFLLSATAQSFKAVPILGLRFNPDLAMFVSDTAMTDLFEVAVKIAAPAMVTLFLITVAMGFMARTVPEMNIFVVGFSLRLVLGFVVLALGIGVFVYSFEHFSHRQDKSILKAIDLMGG